MDEPDGIREIGNALAEATRRALIDVAQRAYEEAGLSGLCEEGRWEVAIGAMRSYDITRITRPTDI